MSIYSSYLGMQQSLFRLSFGAQSSCNESNKNHFQLITQDVKNQEKANYAF